MEFPDFKIPSHTSKISNDDSCPGVAAVKSFGPMGGTLVCVICHKVHRIAPNKGFDPYGNPLDGMYIPEDFAEIKDDTNS